MNRRGFFKRVVGAIAAIASGSVVAKTVEPPVMSVHTLTTHTSYDLIDFQSISGQIFFEDIKKCYEMSFDGKTGQ